MNQPNEEAAVQLKREHEAAKHRLESLREEARKLGHEFEEKLKPEILEAEVEPVSYTHLDVYKRQLRRELLRRA